MKIKAFDDISNVEGEEEIKRYVTQFNQAVKDAINGNIDFVDNCRTNIVSITFSASNTDTTVGHGLGRVPQGYILVGSSSAMSVYNGSGNTASQVTLRSSATGTASVLLF